MVSMSFSMAMTVSQRPERANAMALPPTPAKRSITVVLAGDAKALRPSATLLLGVSF